MSLLSSFFSAAGALLGYLSRREASRSTPEALAARRARAGETRRAEVVCAVAKGDLPAVRKFVSEKP